MRYFQVAHHLQGLNENGCQQLDGVSVNTFPHFVAEGFIVFVKDGWELRVEILRIVIFRH